MQNTKGLRTESQPVNPIPEKLPDIDSNQLELLKLYMEEWKTIIQTQMHFNDLIIRFRSITLTATVALIGGAVAIQDKAEFLQDNKYLILAIPLVFWFTAFILDYFYYHKLLLGAVTQAKKYDTSDFGKIGYFGLTASIKLSVQPPTSRKLLRYYYLIPMVALIVGIAILLF